VIEIKIPLKKDGVKKSLNQLIKEAVNELHQYQISDDMRLVKFTKGPGAITLKYDDIRRISRSGELTPFTIGEEDTED